MSKSGRLEHLLKKLQARTDHQGDPLPGYKQNVAVLRAEIAQLQEDMEAAKNGD